MAQRSEIITVYAVGLIQGVALVTFPAANAVFTSPSDYGLSNTEYGGMFVPQAVMAIISSLLGAGLRKRVGTKRIYMLGLFANLLAMSLLVASRFVMKDHSLAYCHRSLQNQPAGVESKPATLRCFIHIWFLDASKGFSINSSLLAHTLPNGPPLWSLGESKP
jgi:MFS-type transporter involved in bile tolerance (Atg22 family)